MQDESIQLRPISDHLLSEQKAGIQELAKFTVAQQQREKERQFIREQGVVENIFSKPIKKPESALVEKLASQELQDRIARDKMEQGFESPNKVEVPASLYQQLNGKTVLRSVLGLERDDAETLYINDYILQKMRTGKMQDTRENFEKVFNRLLARNNLGRSQKSDYILHKLNLYLSTKNIDEEDDLVRSLISKHRGRRNVRR